MTKEHGFLECDTCRAKSGSPVLCSGCLHNRAVFEQTEKALIEVDALLEKRLFTEASPIRKKTMEALNVVRGKS